MPARNRRPSPDRTPVLITAVHLNRRTGRPEAWAAVSADESGNADGKYRYCRAEDPKTTWEIRAEGHEGPASFALAPSLPKATRMTADGSALRIIERMEAELAGTLAKADAR